MLEGFSLLASPGHARMHINTCLPDSNRHASFVHLLLQGISAIGHGLALTAAEFLVFAFVLLVELESHAHDSVSSPGLACDGGAQAPRAFAAFRLATIYLPQCLLLKWRLNV